MKGYYAPGASSLSSHWLCADAHPATVPGMFWCLVAGVTTSGFVTRREKPAEAGLWLWCWLSAPTDRVGQHARVDQFSTQKRKNLAFLG